MAFDPTRDYRALAQGVAFEHAKEHVKDGRFADADGVVGFDLFSRAELDELAALAVGWTAGDTQTRAYSRLLWRLLEGTTSVEVLRRAILNNSTIALSHLARSSGAPYGADVLLDVIAMGLFAVLPYLMRNVCVVTEEVVCQLVARAADGREWKALIPTAFSQLQPSAEVADRILARCLPTFAAEFDWTDMMDLWAWLKPKAQHFVPTPSPQTLAILMGLITGPRVHDDSIATSTTSDGRSMFDVLLPCLAYNNRDCDWLMMGLLGTRHAVEMVKASDRRFGSTATRLIEVRCAPDVLAVMVPLLPVVTADENRRVLEFVGHEAREGSLGAARTILFGLKAFHNINSNDHWSPAAADIFTRGILQSRLASALMFMRAIAMSGNDVAAGAYMKKIGRPSAADIVQVRAMLKMVLHSRSHLTWLDEKMTEWGVREALVPHWTPKMHHLHTAEVKRAVKTVLLVAARLDVDRSTSGCPGRLPTEMWYLLLTFLRGTDALRFL